MAELPQTIREAQRERWVRGAHMLLFLLLYNVAQVVALLVALLQFGFSVFTGETNRPLLVLGLSLRACEEIDQRSADQPP